MADVREKVEQIRQAVYGKEVRESIASGIEAINTEVESTTQRQTTLETDMAEAKREAEEAATRANTAAGDAEDITEAMAVWEEYDPEKDYVPLNKTTYQGSSYINVLACKGVPPTEETHWLPIASKGDKGEPGPMPTIIVGDTTTLSPGSAASVTRRADSPDDAPVLDFGIPRGVDGTGAGDMSKAIYDDNDDGKVNAADVADRVPDGAITDDMLSDDPNHIKARLSSHMADVANNVKSYGAVGDDISDDTSSIQLAHDNLPIGGTLLIPSGEYRVAGLNLYREDITIRCDGVLKPLTNDCAPSGYVVMLGRPDKEETYRIKGNLDVRSGNDWFTTTATGILVRNVYESDLVINVEGFNVNFDVLGDGTGCSYNKFTFLRNYNGKRSVRVRAINQGWANENTYFGGRYGNGTGKLNYDDVVYFDIGDFDYYSSDSNHFFHPSIEGKGKLAIIRGSGHKIHEARLETREGSVSGYPDDYIHFMPGSKNNSITTVYDTFNQYGIKKTVATTTRVSEGRLKFIGIDLTAYLKRGSLIFLVKDDGSKFDTIVCNARYADGDTTVYITHDTAGMTIVAVEYLSIKDQGNDNKFISYRNKRYADGRPVSKEVGGFFVGVRELPAVIYSTVYATTALAWIVNYLGATKASLDFGGNLMLAGAMSSNNILLKGTKISMAASEPTTGAHERGEIILKTSPAAGGILGWVCVSAGTPGTWRVIGQNGAKVKITAAPEFVGQIAVVSGVGYLATGVSSTADWKAITN